MRVGQLIYGYCRGMFGRDHYGTWRVEALGYDWVVVRKVGEDGGALDFMCLAGDDITFKFAREDFVDPDNPGKVKAIL